MQVKLFWAPGEEARWRDFWHGIADLGELGHRESQIVAGVARQGIAYNFEHEKAPNGTPWAPLRPYTVRERRSGIDARGVPFHTGGHHPILQRTGDLKRSFTDPAHPRNITRTESKGGVTVIYLSARDDPRTPHRISTLNSGGLTMTNALVPARPFVGLGKKAAAQLYTQLSQIIYQRVERL